MNLQNISELPAFLNPVVALHGATRVRLVTPGANAQTSAREALLPQTRALLERLSQRDERLAEALEAWGGLEPAATAA